MARDKDRFDKRNEKTATFQAADEKAKELGRKLKEGRAIAEANAQQWLSLIHI